MTYYDIAFTVYGIGSIAVAVKAPRYVREIIRAQPWQKLWLIELLVASTVVTWPVVLLLANLTPRKPGR